MRRMFVLLLVMGLVVGGLTTAEAAKKKKKKPKRVERVVEYRYESPSVGATGAGGVTLNPGLSTGPDEIYLSLEQTDDVSPVPNVRFSWDTDGDGQNDTGVNICGGKTEEPVELPGGIELGVFTYPSGGAACPGTFNTTGTLKITLSNMP